MNPEKKRSRSTNWDEDEKQLFRLVLKGYSRIIENKSSDTNTNKIKAKAWEEVHKKFNKLNARPRHLNQLKIQWKSMKQSARKSMSTFNKESSKTGGGARPKSPPDEVVEIKNLLNPAQLLRDDDDGIIITPSTSNAERETVDQTCVSSQISSGKTVPRKSSKTGFGSKKDHDDCVITMMMHSRTLKDEEHTRRMEMAEEEHKIKMEIHRENLKSAVLEREILEIRKQECLATVKKL